MEIIPLSSQALTDAIEEVFASANHPKTADAPYFLPSAAEHMYQIFSEKPWQEITPDELLEDVDAMFFLTARGFSYFVPALMTACVSAYSGIDLVPDHLVALLTRPPANAKQEAFFEEYTAQMTYAQKSTVAWFLLFLTKEHAHDFTMDEPLLALSRYWAQFLGESE